jgi:hypothetical protein
MTADSHRGTRRIPLLQNFFSIAVLAVLSFRPVDASSPHLWTPEELPFPKLDARAVCGRHARRSAVCNPDRRLSESAAEEIERTAERAAASKRPAGATDCPRGRRGRGPLQLNVAVLDAISIQNGTARDNAQRFVDELYDAWNNGHRKEKRLNSSRFIVLLVVVESRAFRISAGPMTHNFSYSNTVGRLASSSLQTGSLDDAVMRGANHVIDAFLCVPQGPDASNTISGRNNSTFGWFFTLPSEDASKSHWFPCFLRRFLLSLLSFAANFFSILFLVMSWAVWGICCIVVYLVVFEIIRSLICFVVKSHSRHRNQAINPWVHVSFVSSELASRARTFEKCKHVLQRIERDRQRARLGRYEPICCPLCLEDFDPASALSAMADSPHIHGLATGEMPSSGRMSSRGRRDGQAHNVGSELWPLLIRQTNAFDASEVSHSGQLSSRSAFGASPLGSGSSLEENLVQNGGLAGTSMSNFALAVSLDVQLLMLLVMAKSESDLHREAAIGMPFPSNTTVLRCGHCFHANCLLSMVAVLPDLCPVCLSSLFLVRRIRSGGDWDSFSDEYMFRVKRAGVLFSGIIDDDMKKRWLRIGSNGESSQFDPPLAGDPAFLAQTPLSNGILPVDAASSPLVL